MPKLIGGMAALVALAAGVLSQVDTAASLQRAGLAFLIGWLGAEVWSALFGTSKRRSEAASNQAGDR